MYALIENGEITKRSLPRNGRLSDGRDVSNYHQLPPATLYFEGWREIQDSVEPEYDAETQYISSDLEIQGEDIVRVYTVHELPLPGPPSEAELEREAMVAAVRMNVALKVRANELTDEDLIRIGPLFPRLSLDGMGVKIGEVYRFGGYLVEVLQNHITESHWTELPAALYKTYQTAPAPGVTPAWEQPLSTNPYGLTWDDGTGPVIVAHNGFLWENTHEANVWEPGAAGTEALWINRGPVT